MNLVKKIQENIFRYELFERDAKIVIGVSGGPDSVCLLDVLSKLQKKYNLELIVAHVNYDLRGKYSDLDEKLVRNLAEKYSLPIEILKVKNSEIKKVGKSEDKLRTIRYDFFEKVLKKYKADLVAVAHNLNDQAETVLMRILRGTGLRGLGAIRFSSRRCPTAQPEKNADGHLLIRPLLNIPRKEIIAYLRKGKIPYRIDKTNLGTDFTRNKIRNKLLHQLEKDFNPNIQELLCKFSESVAADYDFIARFANAWLAENKNLQVSALNNLHPSICREVLRRSLEKYAPDLREIESAHIDEIMKILKSNKSKRQQLHFKSLKIGRIGDKLIIGR
ncbi:MAG: tRNA lysidine(34) synthetase TilS [Candidatus Moraniibacteriota bacterium]